MLEALGWGAFAASSLVIGALVGLARRWPAKLVGLVLGFGAGALISAVTFELAEEGVAIGGGSSVALGLGAGALTYYFCDGLIERPGESDAGGGPAVGGVPGGSPRAPRGWAGVAAGEGGGGGPPA